jgi:urease accessory protein
MADRLLPLLQFSDSNFPSGAFSHSFGLETYIQEEVIKDKQTFSEALFIYLEKQLVYVDGLACRLAWETLEAENETGFFQLDEVLFASCLSKETRLGNQRIGERMARLCYDLYPSFILEKYIKEMKAKRYYGHSALVFAAVAFHLGIDKQTAVKTYLFSTLNSLVQNAVRGIPLGQTDGQKLLVEIQTEIEKSTDEIMKLSEEDLAAVSPGLEVAQMQHERLHVRIFMS